jgi:putative FmdB family regulatory protein
MPIYEYSCRNCGAAFEKRLKVEERLAAQPCPTCGERSASLIMSAPARVGGTSNASSDFATCPSTGAACGCGRAGHHH